MSGPLAGTRVVEIAGLGACPFAAMMLADMGADVLRVDRPGAIPVTGAGRAHLDLLNRGRRSVSVDLGHPEGVATVLELAERAHALVEGFRPGVAERLGIGPEPCLARNPRLVYGRVTGWGQDGPLAAAAGHDLDFIAVAGALHPIGRAGGPPVPPLNLVGDSGGGGMLLAFGVVCGLLEAGRSGAGQVVDAAMVDGAALLTTMVQALRAAGTWSDERGTNLLDSGAPAYEVYECADGGHVAVAPLEPRFYAELRRLAGLDSPDYDGHLDRDRWPVLKDRLARVFRTRTRAEWCAALEGTDACVAPVLSLAEAAGHPHNRHRATFVEVSGVSQPAPAPRFSRTPGGVRRPPPSAGEHTDAALADWGVPPATISARRRAGAIA